MTHLFCFLAFADEGQLGIFSSTKFFEDTYFSLVTLASFLFFLSPFVASVPTGNKTVPAPLGTVVSHQHLSGGWHPHVVPVERAERLH